MLKKLRQKFIDWVCSGQQLPDNVSFGSNTVNFLGAFGQIQATGISSPGSPGIGKGRLYVKNTSPTTLWFIDDVGNDVQLPHTREDIVYSLSGNQSTGLAVGQNIVFDQSKGGSGGITVSSGRFTLPVNRTYLVICCVDVIFSGTTGSYTFQWDNFSATTYFGTEGTTISTTSTNNTQNSNIAMGVFTATVASNVVQVKHKAVTALSNIEASTWCSIMELL